MHALSSIFFIICPAVYWSLYLWLVSNYFFINKEKDRIANCKLVYIEAMAQFFNNDLDYVVEDYYDVAEFDDNPFENDDNFGEDEVCWFLLILNMKYLILF